MFKCPGGWTEAGRESTEGTPNTGWCGPLPLVPGWHVFQARNFVVCEKSCAM